MAYTTINKSTDYFNTKLWTGTGSSNALTGVGFQPDFTWIKGRSDALSHALFDAVRGTTKVLNSNANTAEYTNTDTLTAFGTDGFTVGSNTGVNASGETRAAWNWKAGTGQGSSNTDGSITSTVSANTTAGFSIVKWTGTGANATVGHGLGAVPKCILVKTLDRNENWVVYHVGNDATAPEDKSLRLDGTNTVQDNSGHFNDTAPTSSVFSVGNGAGVNPNGEEVIAYCFAEKTGYSKIGSYISNNSSNGVFVYTGLKPKFILIKAINEAVDWRIYDSERLGYNNKNYYLEPNNSNSEGTTDSGSNWDMLSNGFKFYTSEAEINGGSGNTYIYMAFGQTLVGSNNVPCTAR